MGQCLEDEGMWVLGSLQGTRGRGLQSTKACGEGHRMPAGTSSGSHCRGCLQNGTIEGAAYNV